MLIKGKGWNPPGPECVLIETKEIQLGGNPTVSEAGIHPWIQEGLGLGGSTPGGGERGVGGSGGGSGGGWGLRHFNVALTM